MPKLKRFLSATYLRGVIRHKISNFSRRTQWIFVYLGRLFFRWLRSPKSREKNTLYGLARCEVRYINLRRRKDRRDLIEGELGNVGVANFSRIEAIEEEMGILGCGRSHILALEEQTEKDCLMVCEDDLMFVSDAETISEIVQEFLERPELDVLCLANNSMSRPVAVSMGLAISDDIQTTACYLVKESGRRLLLDAFGESVEALLAGVDPKKAALDRMWKKLQSGVLIFAVPRANLAVQRPGFSDIAREVVDYGV